MQIFEIGQQFHFWVEFFFFANRSQIWHLVQNRMKSILKTGFNFFGRKVQNPVKQIFLSIFILITVKPLFERHLYLNATFNRTPLQAKV